MAFKNRVTVDREQRGAHVHLTMWIGGANAGAVVVRDGDEVELLDVIEHALLSNGASFARPRTTVWKEPA